MRRNQVGDCHINALLAAALIALTACQANTPAASPSLISPSSSSPMTGQQITPTLSNPALVCPPKPSPSVTEPLAARVNGIGIPLDWYNRQVAQAQAAMAQQGLDPKSAAGQQALKNLREQMLDQVINDMIIEQRAQEEGVKIAEDELNAQLMQVVQDIGGIEKLNEYLLTHQLSIGDLCSQLRAQFIGEAMLNRVTAALPTNVEQVHARHILVPSSALAQTVLTQLRQGRDFSALAQQYSTDEESKANGGDLGWFPRGMMEPQFESAAFQLGAGQVSDVVQTRFGYHLIKVEERESSRALSPETLQFVREQAFFVWLQALRDATKIERLAPQ